MVTLGQPGQEDTLDSTSGNQDVGCTIGDVCPNCGGDDLRPEHAHVKCPTCGYIGPCCW